MSVCFDETISLEQFVPLTPAQLGSARKEAAQESPGVPVPAGPAASCGPTVGAPGASGASGGAATSRLTGTALIVDDDVRSELAGQASMKPQLDDFSRELPGAIRRLTAASGARQTVPMQLICHQLAGSGGSLGFPAITQTARLALGQLRRHPQDAVAIGKAVTDLIRVLERVAVG